MYVALDWIERHCVVPDGFRKGEPFRMYRWQLTYLAHFYLVRGVVRWLPDRPILSPAFVYRRGLLVGPQKLGKSTHTAAHTCLEGVGPALFAGWADSDDGYVCAEHGCRCGWEYAYDPGEPMGMPWPTPLVQITAYSEEQTENIYDALRPMIDGGPLHDLIPKTGEQFIRLPGGGRIDIVTASEQSRLGQRVTFVPQTEVGLWHEQNRMARVADTQYRGLAGMGGRASLETNAWDPAAQSIAQREFESAATDVYRQFTQPPANLSYANKRERRKIHRAVYPSDTLRENGGHVDLDSIEAEAADMATRDLAQAARFFGNKLVSGAGQAFDIDQFRSLAVKPREVGGATWIVLGFDGSRTSDSTGLIATEVISGYQWPLGIWERPLDAQEWEVPGDEVDMTVDNAFHRWQVWLLLGDPAYWETDMGRWQGRHRADRVKPFPSNRARPMAEAVRSYVGAISRRELTHSGDPRLTAHVGNATKLYIDARDEQGAHLFLIKKERPNSPKKIDAASAAVLSWQARTDALKAGVAQRSTSVERPVVVFH